MKSTLLAVFGHYDSRGGTSAYVMKERTLEEVKRLAAIYNQAFAWEEMLKEYAEDLKKPEGKRLWQWDPTQPGSSPADNDFLFIGELWYEGDLPVAEHGGGTDLQDYGAVVIDVDTEPDTEGMDEAKVLKSLAEPTRLEFVKIEGGFYARNDDEEVDDVDRDEWVTRSLRKLDKNSAEVRDWNDDAFGFLIIEEE